MSDNEKPTTDHVGYGPQGSAATEEHLGDEPPHHGMSVGEYLRTRFTSLKPPMAKTPNPIKLLRMLNMHHWAFFGVAFFAWVCASYIIMLTGAGRADVNNPRNGLSPAPRGAVALSLPLLERDIC